VSCEIGVNGRTDGQTDGRMDGRPEDTMPSPPIAGGGDIKMSKWEA